MNNNSSTKCLDTMSSAIPPLIPTVPPPMGSDDENNVDDDDFGDFTTASFAFGCLGESKGSTPEKRSPWIECVDQDVFPETVTSNSEKVDQINEIYEDEIFHNCSETIEREEEGKDLKVESDEKCLERFTEENNADDPEDDESDFGNFEKCMTEDTEEKKVDFLSVDRGALSAISGVQDNTSQDSVISSGATDSGLCSASQKSEEEEVVDVLDAGVSVNATLDDSSGSDETLVVGKKRTPREKSEGWHDGCERTVDENVFPQSSIVSDDAECDAKIDGSRTRLSNDEDDDDFADFSAFRASDKCADTTDGANFPSADCNAINAKDKDLVFKNDDCDLEDDFCDFASATVSNHAEDGLTFQPIDEPNFGERNLGSDDEFSDFAFAPTNSVDRAPTEDVPRDPLLSSDQQPPEEPPISADEASKDDSAEQFHHTEDLKLFQLLQSGKADSCVESLAELAFQSLSDDEGKDDFNGDLRESLNDGPVWKQLQDVETTHALSYQWGGSSSNKALLSALSIDSRNILFGPRWNSTAVPRFAANLGFDPLEPVRAPPAATVSKAPKEKSGSTPGNQPPPAIQPTRTNAVPDSEENVPAAQFDWNSSGLVNPLECLEKEFLSAPEEKVGTTCLTPTQQPLQPTKKSQQQDSHQKLVEKILATETLQKPGGQNSRSSLSNRARAKRRQVEGVTLCPESLAVIHNLPDLSFINARMLMFPLRESSNVDSGPQSCPVSLVGTTSSSSAYPE
ncbi:aftiphilin isoform X2 [Ischnura elegans]|uniref:aftiphilin isoform X2 n=1 Tax=Ischnura elegans TaxID=197161 RepID=UPI001ED8BE70|nr:aftiphilin isoform X2 [Ischnura elegans]